MQTRPCGSSGLDLPMVGLGTWAFGGGSYWGAQDQTDVNEVVAHALELGVTYFDTAEMYNAGASEESLGLALRGRRSAAIIGSKISPSHTYPETLRRHCEASLVRLRTDYVDIYMVHWPIHADSISHFTEDPEVLAMPPTTADAFLALDGLRRQGKIRAIGVSNFGVRQLQEVLDLGVPIAVNELPYNLLMRGIELEIAPFCRTHGIGIIGYMTLMQGVLTGNYTSFDDLPPMRLRTRHFAGHRPHSRHGEAGIEPQTWTAIEQLRAIALDTGWSLNDLAIAWALSNPDIACVLAGCRNREQLSANAWSAERSLPPGLRLRLDACTAEVLQLLGANPDYYQAAGSTRSW